MSKHQNNDNLYETEAAVSFESNSSSDDDDEHNSAINTLPIPEIDAPCGSPFIAAAVSLASVLRPSAPTTNQNSKEKHYSTGSNASLGIESETTAAGGAGTVGAIEGPSGIQADEDDSENEYTRVGEPTSMSQAHLDYYRTVHPQGPTSSGTPPSEKRGQEHPNNFNNVPANGAALVPQTSMKSKPKAPPPPPPVPGLSESPKVSPRGPPPPTPPKPNLTRPLPPPTVRPLPPQPPTSPKPKLSTLLVYSNQQEANDMLPGGAGGSTDPTASFQPTGGITGESGDQIQVNAAAPTPSQAQNPMAGEQFGVEPTSSSVADAPWPQDTSSSIPTTPLTPSVRYENIDDPFNMGQPTEQLKQPKVNTQSRPQSRPGSMASAAAAEENYAKYEYILPQDRSGAHPKALEPQTVQKKKASKPFFMRWFGKHSSKDSKVEAGADAETASSSYAASSESSGSASAIPSTKTKPKSKLVKGKANAKPECLATESELREERERVWRAESERLPVRSLAKYVGTRRLPPRQPGEAGVVASWVVRELVAANSENPAALPTVQLSVSERGVEAISAASSKQQAEKGATANVLHNPVIYCTGEIGLASSELNTSAAATSRVFPIDKLSHVLQDQTYQRIVAIITIESAETRYSASDCHVYLMPNDFEARRVTHAVNVAFKQVAVSLNLLPTPSWAPSPEVSTLTSSSIWAGGGTTHRPAGGTAAWNAGTQQNARIASWMSNVPGPAEAGWSDANSWTSPKTPIDSPPAAVGFSGPSQAEQELNAGEGDDGEVRVGKGSSGPNPNGQDAAGAANGSNYYYNFSDSPPWQ